MLFHTKGLLLLTDGTFVCSRVIYIVVTDSLRPTHLIMKHSKLHLLLFKHLILVLLHFELFIAFGAWWVLSPKLVALVLIIGASVKVCAFSLEH